MALDVNGCTWQQLGAVLSAKQSQKLIEERSRGGQFSDWPELQRRVPGLGPKKLVKLQQFCVLGPAQASQQTSYSRPVSRRSSDSGSANPVAALGAAFAKLRRSLSRQLSRRRTSDGAEAPQAGPQRYADVVKKAPAAGSKPAARVSDVHASATSSRPAAAAATPRTATSQAGQAKPAGRPAASHASGRPAAQPTPRGRPSNGVSSSTSSTSAASAAPQPSSRAHHSSAAQPALGPLAAGQQQQQQQQQPRPRLSRGFSQKDQQAAPPPPPEEPPSRLAQLREGGVDMHQPQQTPREQASEGEGCWWTLPPDSLAPNAPFPQEFCEDARWPGKTSTRRFQYLYDYISAGSKAGTFTYAGQHLEGDAAAALRQGWDKRYPKIAHSNQNGNGRETARHRSNATCSTSNRAQVWADLLKLEATERIPLKLRKRFRCDAYGNVVALHAKGNAVCSFDVDHIFPWSRGGLSVLENLMAVYFGANRHVKVAALIGCLNSLAGADCVADTQRDKIRNAMTETEVACMQCGLSVDHFLELMTKLEQESQNRRTEQQMLNYLDTLLTTPYCDKWNLQGVLQKGNVFLTLSTLYNAHVAALTQPAQPLSAAAGPPAGAEGAAGAEPGTAFGALFGRSSGSIESLAVV